MPNCVNPHNQLQKELAVCAVQKLIVGGGLSVSYVSGIKKSADDSSANCSKRKILFVNNVLHLNVTPFSAT